MKDLIEKQGYTGLSLIDFLKSHTSQERTRENIHKALGYRTINEIAFLRYQSCIQSIRFFGDVSSLVNYSYYIEYMCNIYMQMMYGSLSEDEKNNIRDRLTSEMRGKDFNLCSDSVLGECEKYSHENNQSKYMISQLIANPKYRYSNVFKEEVSNLVYSLFVSKNT